MATDSRAAVVENEEQPQTPESLIEQGVENNNSPLNENKRANYKPNNAVSLVGQETQAYKPEYYTPNGIDFKSDYNNPFNQPFKRLLEKVKKPVSLAKSDIQENNDIHTMDKTFIHCMDKNPTGICERNGCNNSFIKTVSWKRFCSKDCQITEWEHKNERVLRIGAQS